MKCSLRWALLSKCKELLQLNRVESVYLTKEVDMSTLVVITLVLVSPFMAISLLPTLRREESDEEENIVRWRK